jgi:hypothetical protein
LDVTGVDDLAGIFRGGGARNETSLPEIIKVIVLSLI